VKVFFGGWKFRNGLVATSLAFTQPVLVTVSAGYWQDTDLEGHSGVSSWVSKSLFLGGGTLATTSL
jgi:hypothetical protein